MLTKCATKILFPLNANFYSTAVCADVFRHGKHAEFVAAAASSSSFPSLRGLPEVSTLNEAKRVD